MFSTLYLRKCSVASEKWPRGGNRTAGRLAARSPQLKAAHGTAHDSILEACPDYVSLRLPQPMEYAEAQKSLGVAGIERSVVDVIPALPGDLLPAALYIR